MDGMDGLTGRLTGWMDGWEWYDGRVVCELGWDGMTTAGWFGLIWVCFICGLLSYVAIKFIDLVFYFISVDPSKHCWLMIWRLLFLPLLALIRC